MRILFTIFLAFVLILTSCDFSNSISNPTLSSQEVSVEVYFPYFTPYSLTLNSTIDGWVDHEIWQPNTNRFTYTFQNVSGSNLLSIKFGVRQNHPTEPFDINPIWINGKNGIQYAEVKINGVALDRNFSIDNNLGGSNISFEINGDGTPSPIGNPILLNENVPTEVAHIRRYVGNPLPPSDKPYIQGWFQALHDNRYPNSLSTVEVKDIKIFAYINNATAPTLLLNYSFITGQQFNDGGLYYRYPFFLNGQHDYHSSMAPYSIINQNNSLIFHPSEIRNKVWHWWHEPRILSPPGATAYRLEAEVKITAPVCVQAGIDFKNQSSPLGTESGAGDWYFEDNSWQTVIFDTR